MKKTFVVFFIAFIFLFLFLGTTKAAVIAANICDESNGGNLGLVPCGSAINNSGNLTCPCELEHVFVLVLNLYNFAVWKISVPLASLLVVIGGIMLLVSGGNPGLASKARTILWGAVIGIVLVFGAWIIINTILVAIGYNFAANWSSPF